MSEPPHSSVVLAHGSTGTAYQKLYADGLWHKVGSEAARL